MCNLRIRIRLCLCRCLCQNDDYTMQNVRIYVIGMLMACPHTSEGQVSEKDHPHPIPHPANPLINDDITNHDLIEIMETVMIQGGFFNWSAQISVLKRKTLFNQARLSKQCGF